MNSSTSSIESQRHEESLKRRSSWQERGSITTSVGINNHINQISRSTFYTTDTNASTTPISTTARLNTNFNAAAAAAATAAIPTSSSLLLSSPTTNFMPNINNYIISKNHSATMNNFQVPRGGRRGHVHVNVDHDHHYDLAVSTAMIPPPAVTVVLEGRSICHRISLHKHEGYHSLAKALRQMFVVPDDIGNLEASADDEDDGHLDLSNAIPGHLIAYEDMENDLLLVGDLNWKDFVRVAKRIRILPSKTNPRKGKVGVGFP